MRTRRDALADERPGVPADQEQRMPVARAPAVATLGEDGASALRLRPQPSHDPRATQRARRGWAWREASLGMYWRRCLRIPLIAHDSTFINDVIRREHSPPRASS